MSIEFFYDLASPYTYLAMTQMQRIGREADTPVRWRPFFLGGVFKATGNAPPALVAARGRYMMKDLYRWARVYGQDFSFPSRFPANTLLAMRALQSLPEAERAEPSLALGRAYWTQDADITDAAVVASFVGQDAVDASAAHKDALRAATDEAVARGAFGAPTFLVGDALFFGNDRLDFVVREAKK